MVLVLGDDVHRGENVQGVVDSSLDVLEIDLVRKLLVKLKNVVSNVSTCSVGRFSHTL